MKMKIFLTAIILNVGELLNKFCGVLNLGQLFIQGNGEPDVQSSWKLEFLFSQGLSQNLGNSNIICLY